MPDLTNIDTWFRHLGLLPVPLQGHPSTTAEYALFNGSRGNFCLYLDGRTLDSERRSQVWSANLGHGVSVFGEELQIQRWDRPAEITSVSARQVLEFPDAFHRHLEKDAPGEEHSIIAHAIDVFRRLRAVMGPVGDGLTSLQAFLYLIAAAVEQKVVGDLDLENWALDEAAEAAARSLHADDWMALCQTLGHYDESSLRPDLSLTLRHASGVLFQEAHYEAIFAPHHQRPLPGFLPGKIQLEQRTLAVGLHFTPIAIVRTLVEECLSALAEIPGEIVVFDPACGSGEFLREAVCQVRRLAGTRKIHLLGFDVSQAACAMARYILAWEARCGVGGFTYEIHCVDALAENTQWPSGVSMVLMNPPFLSWRDLPPYLRDRVQHTLGVHAGNRPDLASAFLWRALGSLDRRAVLGSVLPSSFFDGKASRSLRSALGEKVAPRLLAHLGSHSLFPAARVDASLYVGVSDGSVSPPSVVWSDHRLSSTSAALRTLRRLRSKAVTLPIEGEGFSVYKDIDLDIHADRAWSPKPYSSWCFARSLAALPRAGSLFDVKQGTITGDNEVFLLSRAGKELLPGSEQFYFRPCVLNDSIRGGQIIDSYFVFYPHGDWELRDEGELRDAVPTYYKEVLRTNRKRLLERARITEQNWWQLSEHRAWQRKPLPKIASTYFGDRGSFAWDADGSAVVVQGYAWLPRARRRRLGRQVWLCYLAFMNSTVMMNLLGAFSRHVGGGQWNLSKRYVERIPLPDFFGGSGAAKEYLFEIEQLAALGHIIHRDGLIALNAEQMARLDELSAAVCGAESGVEGDYNARAEG